MKYYINLICCIALAVVFKLISDWGKNRSNYQDINLLIGIMSSRENFEARESVRKTWTSIINNSDEKYFFIVGSDYCNIPVEDRLSIYSCERWKVTLPQGIGEINEQMSSEISNLSSWLLSSDLIVQVQHPIIIQRICVLSNLVKTILKVSLIDAVLDQTVFTVSFTNNDNDSNELICKSVERFEFPKYFEAKILIKDQINQERLKCNLKLIDKSQIILYRSANKSENIVDFCVPLSIVYSVKDVDNLKEHLYGESKRLDMWTKFQNEINLKLHEEAKLFNDLLFINVADYYQNLPKKMLQFVTWADKHVEFKYLLKTDDDTFIDLERVRNELELMPVTNLWWSKFRINWLVQRFGKWRDDSYLSLTYPPFPCGAGYVLSSDIVEILANSANFLHCYQGEDVSMGIWLAPYNPVLYDSCWECSEVVHGACNVPQLSTQLMYDEWKMYLHRIK